MKNEQQIFVSNLKIDDSVSAKPIEQWIPKELQSDILILLVELIISDHYPLLCRVPTFIL